MKWSPNLPAELAESPIGSWVYEELLRLEEALESKSDLFGITRWEREIGITSVNERVPAYDVMRYRNGLILGENTDAAADHNDAVLVEAMNASTAVSSFAQHAGTLHFPPAKFYVNTSFVVKNGVICLGTDRRATEISPGPSFQAGNPLVRLGPIGGGVVFSTRLERFGIDCLNRSSVTACYTEDAQEGGGLYDVVIRNCAHIGFDVQGGGAWIFIKDCEFFINGNAGGMHAVRLNRGGGQLRVDGLTAAGGPGAVIPVAFKIDAGQICMSGFHPEYATVGVEFGINAFGAIIASLGHFAVPTHVAILPGNNGLIDLINIWHNTSPQNLDDQYTGRATAANIGFYHVAGRESGSTNSRVDTNVPLLQWRTVVGDPNGGLTPRHTGEVVRDTSVDPNRFWQAGNLTNTGWL